MRDIVFLPATAPQDQTYGIIPEHLDVPPDVIAHSIRFPIMVWYNQSIRDQVIKQIDELDLKSIILIGFSKSGLGAWNIAKTIPERIAGTIIFDAPVARMKCPPWGTQKFYENDKEWLRDLPILSVDEFRKTMPATHKLVLISGESFHEEMRTLSENISQAGISHHFLPCPTMSHHWNAGWIEKGLRLMFM